MSAFKSNPANCFVDVDGLADLDDEYVYTAIPVLDASEVLSDGATPICAQLTYSGLAKVAARLGGEMLTADDVERLHALATQGECIELPAYTGTPTAEVTLEHRKKSDEANRAAAARAGYVRGRMMRICNFGKGWIAGAKKGRAWLMGWFVKNVAAYGIKTRSGPGFIQPRPAPGSEGAHGAEDQADDGTNSWLKFKRSQIELLKKIAAEILAAVAAVAVGAAKDSETPMRSTIRLGSSGEDVAAWQRILNAFGHPLALSVDGGFGPKTEAATKVWQQAHGLVADGVVGAKSWTAAGEKHSAAVVPKKGDPRSPACVAAKRDADAAWPSRKRASDGIMGDARHQASVSDHNVGNAIDLTHDPASGADGHAIAAMALTDHRTKYVIWNAKIWNNDLGDKAWRPYKGSNPHKHHVHISIRDHLRHDASPWPWAPSMADAA